MPASPQMQRRVGRGASIVIPLIILGLLGYATWVVIHLVTIRYLLHPSSDLRALRVEPRHGAGIAVIVIYFLLLFLTLLTYFRSLYIIHTDPGLIPLGDESITEPPLDGLEPFYTKDVFVSDVWGRPIWCNKCRCYKPDRSHHCSEINRCVKRMDHFCPWVGGIVSETNMKFFIQFCFWSGLYCIFITTLIAKLFAERKAKTGQIDVNWAAALGIGGLFTLFTVGMACSILQMTASNLTTIENLDKGYKQYNLAIRINLDLNPTPPVDVTGSPLNLITMPLTAPPHLQRTFAVVQTSPGDNPWDLGWRRNLQSVLGHSIIDWLLPIRRSPCSKHDRDDCEFEFGPVVDRLRKDHGLVPVETEKPVERRRHRHHHHKHRRSSSHRASQNGDVKEEKQIPT